MLKAQTRDWLVWVLAACLGVSALSAITLALDIGHPFGGFLEESLPFWNDRLQINGNTPAWWPNITTANLRNHGLLRLNGQPYRPHQPDTYSQLLAAGETHFTLTLDRNGREEDERLPLQIFSWSDYIDLKLPNLINGLSLWLLAVVVYSAGPRRPLNRTAALTFALFGAGFGADLSGIFYSPGEPAQWILLLYNLLLWPAADAALAYLAWSFPAPWPGARWAFRACMLLALGMAVLWGGARLFMMVAGWSPLVAWMDWRGFVWHRDYFTAGLALISVHLAWHIARRWRESRARQQAAVVLLGLLAASPGFGIIVLDLWGKSASPYIRFFDLRYFVLFIPLAFAFVILRYKTFQATHPLFLAVFWISFSATLAVVAAGLLAAWQSAPGPLMQSFVPFFLVSLVAGGFWSTQTQRRSWLARVLAWEQRSYEAARYLGQSLLPQLESEILPMRLAQALVDTLHVECAGLWHWPTSGAPPKLAAQAGLWAEHPPTTLAFPVPLTTLLRVNDQSPEWANPLRACGIEVLIPLGAWGVLGVSKHRDEELFDERDVEILELVGQQALLLLTASQQLAELRRVPGRLATAQAQERFRIAQDLHDTIQQQLSGLQPLLEASHDAVAHNPARAAELLTHCVNEVESAAETVSRLRADFAPPELARSFAAAIHALAARHEWRTGQALHLELPDELDAAIAPEHRYDVYLIVRQALDNVVEHAQAKQVGVRFMVGDGRVRFEIVDDGAGFAEVNGDGFGLTSMRAHAQSVGGELIIDSAPGNGTRVAGWAPMVK